MVTFSDKAAALCFLFALCLFVTLLSRVDCGSDCTSSLVIAYLVPVTLFGVEGSSLLCYCCISVIQYNCFSLSLFRRCT